MFDWTPGHLRIHVGEFQMNKDNGQIDNRQSKIANVSEWLTRPGFTTTRCQMGRSERWSPRPEEPAGKAKLKTWPATPVDTVAQTPARPALNFIRSCSLPEEGAAGVGQPFAENRCRMSDAETSRSL